MIPTFVHPPEAIAAKMEAGLSRDQAITVLDNQAAHDSALVGGTSVAVAEAELNEKRAAEDSAKRLAELADKSPLAKAVAPVVTAAAITEEAKKSARR